MQLVKWNLSYTRHARTCTHAHTPMHTWVVPDQIRVIIRFSKYQQQQEYQQQQQQQQSYLDWSKRCVKLAPHRVHLKQGCGRGFGREVLNGVKGRMRLPIRVVSICGTVDTGFGFRFGPVSLGFGFRFVVPATNRTLSPILTSIPVPLL